MYTIIALYANGYGVSTTSNARAADQLFTNIRTTQEDGDLKTLAMYAPDGELIDHIPDYPAYLEAIKK